MGKVIYSVGCTLDGYYQDPDGDFSWANPSEQVVAALTADAETASTYLYGRRMYEAMAGWETDPAYASASVEQAKFAEVWKRADKVVFSSTLDRPWTARTRVERTFTVDAVRRAREEASGNLTIEGPMLAKQGLALGVVDVVEFLIWPVVIGGGARVLQDGLSLALELVRERRFDDGAVQVTYNVGRG
jgi:dihydrofolate reductase